MKYLPLLATFLFSLPAVAADPIVIDTVGMWDTEVKAYTTSERPPTWVPEFNLMIKFADYSSDDILLWQLKKGRKKIGPEQKCKPYTNLKEMGKTRFSKDKVAVDLVFFKCKGDQKKGSKKPGSYSIELSYKQTLQGKTIKNFGTLQLEVIKALQGNHRKPYAHFIENNDIRMNATVLYERTPRDYGTSRAYKMLTNAASRATGYGLSQPCSPPGINIRTWFKEGDGDISRSKMTCLYKGKKVAETEYYPSFSRDYWSFKRKGKEARFKEKWVQATYFLKTLKADPACGWEKFNSSNNSKNQYWLSKKPGEYKCIITGGGDILKEVYFTVGADGKIVKPPCNDKINTLRHVTLLETKTKKFSTAKVNKKLMKKYGFNRVKWAKGCPPTK